MTVTTTEYGIKFHGDPAIWWYPKHTRAQVEAEIALKPERRTLYTREVTEPKRVQTFPTAVGSVIRARLGEHEALFMRAEDDSFPWIGRDDENMPNGFEERHLDFIAVVFDAGA